MKAIGVKALKNQLSRYLKAVQAGETVLVTDRDEVIAEIHSPTLPLQNRVSRWDAWLNAQARAGSLRRPTVAGSASSWEALVSPPPPARIDLRQLLSDSREDRA